MPLRSFVFFGALIAAAGCHKGPPRTLTAEQEREALTPAVLALSQGARALLKTQDELLWTGWTEGRDVDIAKTYEGQDALFTPSTVQQAARLAELSVDPLERRAFRHLELHLAGEYLARELSEVSAAIANLEAGATLQVDGRELPYRHLDRLLANERSTERRRALYASATPTVERLSQSLRRKEERLQDLLTRLGYPSREAFSARLREVDVDGLARLASGVLLSTERAHEKVIGDLARKELGLTFAQLSRADFPRLFRPNTVEALFPKAKLLPTLHATAGGLGIDLDALRNVRIDATETPGKNPRPLTLPVEVPSDVRLSLRPYGGVKDWSASIHELGHALHYGLSGELRWELTKLGNPTIAEAYGYLFEDLLEDPIWLDQTVGLSGERLTQYLAAISAYRLHELREAAGAVLHGIELMRRPDVDPKALHAELSEQVFGHPPTAAEKARFLVDREDFLASADRMRAWFLAGQLQAQLKDRFGPTWWKSPKAGAFLRSLWTHANSRSPDELARLAGERGIRPDVLLQRMATTLQVSIPVGKTPAPAP